MAVFFDHIPKTAGTSVTAALAVAFDQPIEQRNEAHHVAIKNVAARKVIAGHFWFAPGEALASNWYYTTVLRDPIDRFVSQYYFHKLSSQEQPWIANLDIAVKAAGQWSIEDYLRSPDPALKASYVNYQAKHFAARKCLDVDDLCDDELYQAAVDSLSEYNLVGVFPKVPQFLEVLCSDHGVRAPLLSVHNKTTGRVQTHELASAVREQLHARNVVDLRLLAWATERFHQRVGAVEQGNERQLSPPASGVTRLDTLPPVNFGSRQVRIVSVTCESSAGDPMTMHVGQSLDIVVTGQSEIDEPNLTTGIAIGTPAEPTIYGINTAMTGQQLSVKTGQRFHVRFSLALDLAPGTYSVTVAFHQGTSHERVNYEWRDTAAVFRIVDFAGPAFVGRFDLRARVHSQID